MVVTQNYDAIEATKDHMAFQMTGQGVQVLSENERLTDGGERIHTGKSSGPTHEFAENFTKKFSAMAAKYPVYAELKNVFDLAVVSALLKTEDIPNQIGWRMTHFQNPRAYRVKRSSPPQVVRSVVNYRVLKKKYVIAGVSGGVSFRADGLVGSKGVKINDYGVMDAEHQAATIPTDIEKTAWWWD